MLIEKNLDAQDLRKKRKKIRLHCSMAGFACWRVGALGTLWGVPFRREICPKREETLGHGLFGPEKKGELSNWKKRPMGGGKCGRRKMFSGSKPY